MEAVMETANDPHDYGDCEGGLHLPGCTVVGATNSDRESGIIGDVQGFYPQSSVHSQVPGTDSELLDALDGSSSFPPLSSNQKKRKLTLDTGALPLTSSHHPPTYAGFKDPDFFSLSAYTPT